MKGLASNYGLYMIAREDIPRLKASTIEVMRDLSYAQIAFEVLYPFLQEEIGRNDLEVILEDAYSDTAIPTTIQQVTGSTFILWLSHGPTYSFKDYAARFFARILNYFLKRSGNKRVVAVATSGDTGGIIRTA
jgi:threonine synthase